MVGVHESTVRRWCDSGEVDVQLTAGGHRRIPLRSLLALASQRGLATPLLNFGEGAEDAYRATAGVRGGVYEQAGNLLYRAFREGRASAATRFVELQQWYRVPLGVVLDELLAPVMHRTGREWCDGVLTVADEHEISRLMEDVLHDLRRRTRTGEARERAVVACLERNGHDLGAAMVRIVLEAAGWEVIYLGADVPIGDLARKQHTTASRLVCVSLTEPQVPSDAARLIHLLSGLYDPQVPYRLALGGAPLRRSRSMPMPSGPFLDCAVFDTLKDFAGWV
jgi:methylmalonyl-CoA mutase cobalamin-binding subunit